MSTLESVPEVSGEVEQAVLEVYQALKALLERPDLPPGVRTNAATALSAMWQAANNLGASFEMLYDLGL